jgi:ABC-type sulfate transport system permease component
MPVDRYWLALAGETTGLAAAFAVALGVPLAWILENRQFAGKRTVSAILTAATLLPAPLLCYLLMRHGSQVALPGMASAGVLSVLPVLAREMQSAFAALNRSYGKAARSLGAPEWLVFARVELPLVWRPLAGVTVWALTRLILELMAAFWIAERRI